MNAALPSVQAAERHRSVARSHVGRVRAMNEDRVLDRGDRGLWAVADGMGGHRGGDVAADMTIAALRQLADEPLALTPDRIADALVRANADVHARAAEAGGVIGSTIVVLHIDGASAHALWAGDSRAYLVRAGTLRQLTRDHSLVQALVDAGAITDTEAMAHPQANVITRAIGVDPAIEIERHGFAVVPGDQLLLCSDGLSRTLTAADVREWRAGDDLAANRLLARALERDGSDNISFIGVTVDG